MEQLVRASGIAGHDTEAVAAITELAAAADSLESRKEMNATLLTQLKSPSSKIRLAAIRCEESLTARLGEDWLAMLPEMLPCISELQEDDVSTYDLRLQPIYDIMLTSSFPFLGRGCRAGDREMGHTD